MHEDTLMLYYFKLRKIRVSFARTRRDRERSYWQCAFDFAKLNLPLQWEGQYYVQDCSINVKETRREDHLKSSIHGSLLLVSVYTVLYWVRTVWMILFLADVTVHIKDGATCNNSKQLRQASSLVIKFDSNLLYYSPKVREPVLNVPEVSFTLTSHFLPRPWTA